MDTSIFHDKSQKPDDVMLSVALGKLFAAWQSFRAYVFELCPNAVEEWNYTGEKYGWSFRIKDKKRAIVYLLPRDGYFMAALVFGEKATMDALKSEISTAIKDTISSAKVYAEGRGFRIEVKDESFLNDIKTLIDFKLRSISVSNIIMSGLWLLTISKVIVSSPACKNS